MHIAEADPVAHPLLKTVSREPFNRSMLSTKILILACRATWLSPVISWVVASKVARRQSLESAYYLEDEVFTTMHKLQAIYRDAHTRDDPLSASKASLDICMLRELD